MDAELVADRVISLSDCISPAAPSTWTVQWSSVSRSDREEAAERIGVSARDLDDAIAWTTEREKSGDVLWPDVLASIDVAREFVNRFIPKTVDARILEGLVIGEDATRLLEELRPRQQNEDPPGIFKVLQANIKPMSGGTVLGSDVVGLEAGGDFHSYLCNGLERDFFTRWQVMPGDLALYPEHAVARECAFLSNEEELGEPVPWFAVRLVEHSRE